MQQNPSAPHVQSRQQTSPAQVERRQGSAQVAFIFSDAEVKEEGFLEYINQLLMTGEVSGLFPKDELDAVINDIRPIYLAECPGATPLAP